ncbi:zinc metalloprotease [Candidatus Levyibacteriota bacterium]|nr:site-2 protease family protein [Candidatus Levybacteria bacterium]GDX62033.1 zinc metalloprotease [Candidatus Levybacteria bacterium]
MITLIIFLLVLSILVLIHEAGHYFVAKKFNIKVEEFGFGIPPRLWGKKIGETIYSINWLPIGGFVKLLGEDEAGGGKISVSNKELVLKEKDKKRAFFNRPVRERAAVVVAGVVMNALLAVIIYYIYFSISGFKTELILINNYKFSLVNQVNNTDIIVRSFMKNSPAEKIGLKEFSKIISINGKKLKNFKEFISIVNENKGKEVFISWSNDGSNKVYIERVTPRKIHPKNEGALGIVVTPNVISVLYYETFSQKLFSGFVHPVNLLMYNFSVINEFIKIAMITKDSSYFTDAVSGPVGIYSVVGEIIKIPNMKDRILQILNLAGMLSISLAFFNVLPIPALDGGRLLFILIEGVTGKKVNSKIESYAHTMGMIILLLLIILITYKDIVQIFFRH